MNTIHPAPLPDIQRLYMERPGNIAHYSLGMWFAAAHKDVIPYPQQVILVHSVTVDRALQQIKDMKLDNLSLEALSVFNLRNSSY